MAPFKVLYGRRCRTPVCWYESGESIILGLEIVQQTTEKIKMIREKMKVSRSRKKSYHDKRRKDLEFDKGDHVFLKRVGDVAYRVALPPELSNLHDVFQVSLLRKYISNMSHVIPRDEVQVRDNFMVEATSIRIEDRKIKQLRGKDIPLVIVAWGGAAGGSVASELESKMRELYPELLSSDTFSRTKIF
ncbi:uncharacterized protein LOC131658563 [Vicia villosa]|uniref:uncharacterized protein LOC131658563 n=1 Tax=Vicia villosa TaxID=3911 RepID=UPI00273C4DC1|nr:uncharacterized protein LOC131658563 [Vicia villosa]